MPEKGRGEGANHFLLWETGHSWLGPGPVGVIDGGHFFDYTTEDGKEAIINRNPGTTRATDKWQGYLPGNCRF